MNTKGITAIDPDSATHLCMKCLCRDKPVRTISISALGYGSGFDGISTKIQLCDSCYAESNPEIWSLEIVGEDYSEEYKHEADMFRYIGSLPLESQELVRNTYETGYGASYIMDAQDWIDYQLNELPHDKCKEYGLYSSEEIAAYKERFFTCEYPYTRSYNDGSEGGWCALHGAHENHVSCECYECADYKVRCSPRRTVKDIDSSDYELFVQSNVYRELLEKKFA